MPLMNRFINLFTADVHAVLDRLEEPATLLRQAIRDMDEAIARQHIAINVLDHDNERDEVLLARERETIDATTQELDTCLAAEAEDLARTLIRRRLEAERRHAAVSERLTARRKRRAALGAELSGNRERLAAMREKQALYEDRDNDSAGDYDGAAVSAADVEIALLREKERRTGA